MPISFFDEFWVMDPYNPPSPGTVLTVENLEVVDQNSNGVVARGGRDSIDGSDIRSVYPGDTVTVSLMDGSTVTITGATFYLADGRQVFTPTDGSSLQDAALISTSYVSTQSSVANTDFAPCFTPGTMIETISGPVAVEMLAKGDLVLTADAGPVPLVFLNRRHLSAAHLNDNPKHCPVRIKAGALGVGVPDRDLTVSPQHRMVLSSAVAQRMFGVSEIMVPACQLVGQPGIDRMLAPDGVDYVHILLDHHAVVFAENAPTETLFLGEQVHETLNEREIALLRSCLSDKWQTCMTPARPFVRGARLRRLLQRLKLNNKPLVDGLAWALANRPDDQLMTG